MDLDLPDLSVVEPSELDNPEIATPEEYEEDLAQQEEDNNPFKDAPSVNNLKKVPDVEEMEEPAEKPKKKAKKPLSEKQLAHLARIRKLAAEKKAAKVAAKKEAVAKVNEEHKAKAYDERQKKNYQKRSQAEYKARTKKVVDEVVQAPPADEKLDKDFLADRRAKEKAVLDEKIKNEQMSFMNFMNNMERFEMLKSGYNEAKKKKTTKAAAPSAKSVSKEKPKQVIPAPLVEPPKKDPFSDYFG